MKKLTPKAFQQAKSFIMNHGRKLEQRLFEYHFEAGGKEAVLEALSHYQNSDGGFGHGLEPDLRTAVSSARATTVGFQVLREVKVSSSNPMVQAGINYFLATYDAKWAAWKIVPDPDDISDAPHAPWWRHDPNETAGEFLSNPRPEIVGYFHEYSELVSADFLAKLTTSVLTHLETLTAEKMDMHEVFCYISLAETEKLPEIEKNKILKKIIQAAPYVVTREPEKWTGYCAKPLSLAPFPTSPLAEVLKKEVEVNLDYEIEHQNPDGSWSPTWDWGRPPVYPEVWEEAKREWAGMITLDNLKKLRAFGRIKSF